MKGLLILINENGNAIVNVKPLLNVSLYAIFFVLFCFTEPGTWYKFRVENGFRFGSGRSSSTINCTTKTEGTKQNHYLVGLWWVQLRYKFGPCFLKPLFLISFFVVLKPPLNVSLELKSSIAILLKWIPPVGSSGDVLGYKVSQDFLTPVRFHIPAIQC